MHCTLLRTTLCFVGSALACLIPQAALAQNSLTTHIGQKEGFANNAVWAFMKDSKGFMWYGTADGLYRYDGYSHVAYTYNEDDSTTLSDNFIFCLFEDSRKKIWIGTLHGGVSLYDPITNSFQRCFPSDSVMRGSQVNAIVEDRSGNIWIASSRGLHRFNGKELKHIFLSRGSTINGSRSHLRSLYIDDAGKIWLGGYASSLGSYDPKREKFEHFQSVLVEKSIIRKIVDDGTGNLWMVSYEGGLMRFNKKTKTVKRWTPRDISNTPIVFISDFLPISAVIRYRFLRIQVLSDL